MDAARRLLFGFGAILLACAGDAPATPAPAVLSVCLDENLPPFSSRQGGEGSGFDVALSRAIGDVLKRPVSIRWFESRADNDKSPVLEANALLSDKLCDLVGNFPLSEDTLEPPGLPTARLPDYSGSTSADRRRRVVLGRLAPTTPIRYAALGVILGPGAAGRTVQSLADLAGMKIGSEAGTFADVVLMKFRDGLLISGISHVVPGRGLLFAGAESGEFQAVLADLGRFDAYRLAHPDTRLRASGYAYRTGFNMGFVALSTEEALIADVNRAIEELRASGRLEAIARAEGITYLAPHEPAVSPHILFSELEN